MNITHGKTTICAALLASAAMATAASVTLAGRFDDAGNAALVASDLGAPSFTDDRAVANNLALYAFTLTTLGAVTIQSTGFASGGADPYFSLFRGAGADAALLGSNYAQAFSTGGDFLFSAWLDAGAYQIALGSFANLSFAENSGSGVLGDGFVGLGQAGALGDGSYRLMLTTLASPLSEPSALGLLVLGLLALATPKRSRPAQSPGPSAPPQWRPGLPTLAALALVVMVPGDARSQTPPTAQTNVVAYWNDVANRTVLAVSPVSTTPEEKLPAYHLDLATVHLAVYDALSAIDDRYEPFAAQPARPARGASLDAAAGAAAFGVLQALFPHRQAQYQAAYDTFVATIPDGNAKTAGLAWGRAVAAHTVALRADDGRAVVLAPYVSSTAPGRFRSANVSPLNRYVPHVRPFALTRADQFRPAGPPALGSAVYAADLNESQARGGSVSSVRSAQALEVARFHTEAPGPFLTRNLGRFASSTTDVVEAARLMALIYVVHADVITACFEAKYFHEAWRPASAIPLADSDGNEATTADKTWVPVLPTPNHPEYPAAHSCTAGGLAEALRLFHGTRDVSYTFDSRVTGTSRTYTSTDAISIESEAARVDGGMHFRFSAVDGVTLGTQVAQWVFQHHFARRR